MLMQVGSMERVAMPIELLETLEAIMFEAVGMTAVALTVASAGELTLPQWRAVVVLGRRDATRVGDLARALGMSLPSTSRLIQRLERRDLVVGTRDESDRRARLLQLTSHGHAVREAVVQQRRHMIEQALERRGSGLPSGLRPGLAAIAAALDAYR